MEWWDTLNRLRLMDALGEAEYSRVMAEQEHPRLRRTLAYCPTCGLKTAHFDGKCAFSP